MTAIFPLKPGQQGNSNYTFISPPRTVPVREKYRDKYRDPNVPLDKKHYGNIMYDRRVHRGNTWASGIVQLASQPDVVEVQKKSAAAARRRAAAKQRAAREIDDERPSTAEPVEGRKHQDVQTELYLEELYDRVEETDVQCQTDYFLDRPSTPLFVPAKTGLDAETQIYEGDLFVFDVEVKPILEVLVGKTVEQSLLEVMEEEELADLRAQQRTFIELRNAELAETQRLEEKERRHKQEKLRRMKQQKEAEAEDEETAEKIASRSFAQGYLSDLVPAVFTSLTQSGYFYDPVERDVETGFMVWLMDDVLSRIENSVVARNIMDSVITDVVTERNEAYDQLKEELKQQYLMYNKST